MDLNSILDILPFSGAKTYLAAVGLLALGVYQVTQGSVPVGLQSILAGLTALGLRHAVAKTTVPAV